jgi:hypothetical protein
MSELSAAKAKVVVPMNCAAAKKDTQGRRIANVFIVAIGWV